MKAQAQEKIDNNSDVWLAADVANHLKISLASVYKGVRNGNIPCAILGKKVIRFSRTKIVNLI